MVPKLRARHRFIWILWTILLPVGFLAGVWAIPGTQQKMKLEDTSTGEFKIIATQQDQQFSFSIVEKDSTRYLEISTLKPLTRPSSFVYIRDVQKSGNEVLLGMLNEGDIHHFPLDTTLSSSSEYQCTLKDIIKNEPYYTLNLSL